MLTDITHRTQGTNFLQHMHTAYWQYKQCKETLKPGQLLQVIDFAKNRSTFYDDEIKGAFYSPISITMHPVVSFYWNNNKIVRHSIVVFSNDPQHDYNAVDTYLDAVKTIVVPHMSSKIEEHIIWSDGCASQYKCCSVFADISVKQTVINRNYYGSEHGKGDAIIGVVNRALDRAIYGGNVVINNAKDAYKWCDANFKLETVDSRREYIYVDSSTIQRQRSHTMIKAVKNTRKIHQVRNTGMPYEIMTRSLSCFCEQCQNGTLSTCENQYTRCKLVSKECPIDDICIDQLLNMDIDRIPEK